MTLLLRKILIGLLLSMMPSRLFAATTRTWDGGGADNKWSTVANWSNDTAPGTGDTAAFGSGFASGTTINLDVNKTVLTLSLNATTSFTIANNTLTLGNGDITRASTASGTHLITSALTIAGAAAWSIDGA